MCWNFCRNNPRDWSKWGSGSLLLFLRWPYWCMCLHICHYSVIWQDVRQPNVFLLIISSLPFSQLFDGIQNTSFTLYSHRNTLLTTEPTISYGISVMEYFEILVQRYQILSSLVTIQKITSPFPPCFGQCGLFAATTIPSVTTEYRF